ncbi:alpha/beta fold hydrolase [Demequina subtropica]|uniref:alpha/beta fold hydrolase n=1 Tax=Demequina subtropica TaxID=1638989 RepID=UPI0007806B3A|nr:alpha/beta hydrolase [Demequina subtropica]
MEAGTVQARAEASRDAQLAYRRHRSEGPMLVLLHGITDGGATWARVAGALDGGFDLVMPDARGHGGSCRVAEPLTLDLLAEDVAATIEALGGAPALVWGHSMGAATAALLAATRPELVRAVILEDPPFHASETMRTGEDPHLAAWVASLAGMRDMSAGERLAIARRDNPGWDRAELEPWAETKAQLDTAALALLDGALGARWRATLARVSCPALLVTGDPDLGAIVTPEVAAEALALLPRGEVARVDGAGHSVHRDRFTETLEAVHGFLARVP